MHLPVRLPGSLAALAALLGAPACTDAGPAGSEDPTPIIATTCAPESQLGVSIVACGFGPSIAITAIDDTSIYAVSSVHTLFGVDLQTAEVTRLYHSLDGYADLPTLEQGMVAHDHALYFLGMVEIGGGVSDGVLSIDGQVPTAATPDVVLIADRYAPIAPLIGDAQRMYASSYEREGFSTFQGPIVAIGYDGSIAPITTDLGSPVAVVDGHLYYRVGDQLARVATTGGPSQLVAAGLSTASHEDRAIDAGFAYVTTAATPYQIQRVPVGGGPAVDVALAPQGDVEIPIGPPHGLRLDGDSLYFLQSLGGSYELLTRAWLDGSQPPQTIAEMMGLGTPQFDATSIYIAYQRGGGDAPIEGVVARIAK